MPLHVTNRADSEQNVERCPAGGKLQRYNEAGSKSDIFTCLEKHDREILLQMIHLRIEKQHHRAFVQLHDL